MIKTILSLLVLTSLLSQSSFTLELDQIIQDLSKKLAENKDNLSLQLKAGLDGLTVLEAFGLKTEFKQKNDIQYFLKYYISYYHYILDTKKNRDQYIKKLVNRKDISEESIQFIKEFSKLMTDDIDKEMEIKEKMNIGNLFPALPKQTKDIYGKIVNLESFKNKVVLIDFWATWCMPCIKELPNVQAAYKQFHDNGFEIISISLDHDKSAFEKFIKNENMSWIHIFDGKGWEAELAQFFYIKSIPATFLLKNNKIIAKDLRGEELINKLNEVLKN